MPEIPDQLSKLLTALSAEDIDKAVSKVEELVGLSATVTELTEKVAQRDSVIKKLLESNFKAAVQTKIDNWSNTIPEVVLAKLSKFGLSLDEEKFDELASIFDELVTLGFIEAETGSSNRDSIDGDAVDKFERVIDSIQKENPEFDYDDALTLASAKYPKLADQYILGG